jgi:hypothetical protein
MSDFHDRKPIVCDCGDHAFVAITRGFTTMVSPEDVSLLERKWYAQVYHTGRYRVRRDFRKPGSGTRKLSRENLAALILSTPGKLPDHKSGDALDNRRPNLRPATQWQNAANVGLPRSNKSGFKGVRKESDGWWHAYIQANNKHYHLGKFHSAEAAAAAYDREALRLHGEFARTNQMIQMGVAANGNNRNYAADPPRGDNISPSPLGDAGNDDFKRVQVIGKINE